MWKYFLKFLTFFFLLFLHCKFKYKIFLCSFTCFMQILEIMPLYHVLNLSSFIKKDTTVKYKRANLAPLKWESSLINWLPLSNHWIKKSFINSRTFFPLTILGNFLCWNFLFNFSFQAYFLIFSQSYLLLLNLKGEIQ